MIGIDAASHQKDTSDRIRNLLMLVNSFSESYAKQVGKEQFEAEKEILLSRIVRDCQSNLSNRAFPIPETNFGFPVIIVLISSSRGEIPPESLTSFREVQGFLRKACLCFAGSLLDVATDEPGSCDLLRKYVAHCLFPDSNVNRQFPLQIEVTVSNCDF